MAIYVLIHKTDEDEQSASYIFGPSEDRTGSLSVDKKTGEVEITAEVPGDDKKAYSSRAKRKVLVNWRENKFPDKTCWAS